MGFSTIGGAGGGSAETPSGGAGSSEHAGVEDNSSSNADQIQINDASVVINKDEDTDMDFRVAGDSNTNLLFCDSSTDRIGIGLNDPNALVHVEANPPVIALGSTGSNDPRLDFYDQGTTNIGATLFLDQSSDTIKVMRTASGSATDGISIVANGDVGVGTITPDSLLEVSKASADAEVLISCYHNTGSTTPKITFRKADNTEASPALVDDDDVLGTIDFLGHDGVNFERGAKIEARVQGTSASNDLPTELTFWTTPDGSNTALERLSIGADGALALKEATSPTAGVDGYLKIAAVASGVAANSVLLLHCDGSDDGTTFTDSSGRGHNGTASGAVTKTGTKKFGTASGYFVGSSSHKVTIGTDVADLEFGKKDFTVECWFKTSAGGDEWANPLISNGTGAANTSNWKIYCGEFINAYLFQGSTAHYVRATTATDDDAWHHMAFVRRRSHLLLFIDGVLEDFNDIGSVSSNDHASSVCALGYDGASSYYTGYIDELRITNGKALYQDDFTTQTVAGSVLPASSLVLITTDGTAQKFGPTG